MDAAFHGGSNDISGGRGRLRRPEISPIYPLQLSPILPTSMASLFLSPAINISPVGTGVNNKFIPSINDTGDY
jgi:hypothetical protein